MALSSDQLAFVHGLKQLKFGGKVIGYISEEGLDWGGDDPTTIDVFAAQVPGAPVKQLVDNPGTDVIKFDLIQLNAQNIADVMGGTVQGTTWKAPAVKTPKEGTFEVLTQSGHKIDGGKCSLMAKPNGKVKGKELFKISCTMTILSSGDSPYSISDGTV